MKFKFKKRKESLIFILIIFLLINLFLLYAQNQENDPFSAPLPDAKTPSTYNTKDTTTQSSPTTAVSSQTTEIPKDDNGKLKQQTIKVEQKEGINFSAGGKEFYVPQGSQVVINKDEKTIKVNLQEGSKIKNEPVKVKKKKSSDEERDIEYRAMNGFVQLPDEISNQMGFAGKKVEFKGVLVNNGNNWYVPAGQETKLKIDGKESILLKNIYGKIKNVNENINVYFKQPEKIEGNYVYLGDRKFVTGSANKLDGNPIELLEGNPYAKMNKNSHLAVQALSNSQIKIENNQLYMKGGGIMNQDAKAFMLSKNDVLFWKKGSGIYGIDSSSINGKTNSEIEFLPYKKDGTPVSQYSQKILFDDKTGLKVVSMTQTESRIYLNQPATGNVVPVNPQPVQPAPIKPEDQIQGPPNYQSLQGPETVYRTKNFIVNSPNGNAKMYAAALEYNRYKNAMEWTGKTLPDWSQPCPVTINAGNYQNGGKTEINFPYGTYGKPINYVMEVQGTPQGILYDTIPHEIMHTVTAETFQSAMPRFIDEGISTTTESDGEKSKHTMMLNQFLRTGRGIPFNSMVAMTEYPRDIMPLYSQGWSATEYLIAKGGGGIEGKRKLFQATGYANKYGWSAALKQYYDTNMDDFQNDWVKSLTAKIIVIFSRIIEQYPEINSIQILFNLY